MLKLNPGQGSVPSQPTLPVLWKLTMCLASHSLSGWLKRKPTFLLWSVELMFGEGDQEKLLFSVLSQCIRYIYLTPAEVFNTRHYICYILAIIIAMELVWKL